MGYVESNPQEDDRARRGEYRWGLLRPYFALMVAIPTFLIWVILQMANEWLTQHLKEAWINAHTVLSLGCWLLLVPCLGALVWQVVQHGLREWRLHERAHSETQQIKEQASVSAATGRLIQGAIDNDDNIEITWGNTGLVNSVKVIRKETQLEVYRYQERLKQMQIQMQATEAGPPKQIAAPAAAQQDDEPFVKPVAPHFNEMCHLITEGRMPLCYVNQRGVSIPVYGTIDDLLSMSITGKPGRGKTTALMYFVAALLKCGAEVFVWDPHGVMAPLALLNGKRLPNMPATARVTYVDRKTDITASVKTLHALLNERDEEYRECVAAGRKYIKHPLLLLADELPVLADYDDDVEAEYKLINRQRKSNEAPLEAPPLQMKLIRKFVMEARKWHCFFIGSSQVIDAEILPTKVSDSLNSRIVFFSSDRKAAMSGLERDVIKNMLPLVRRAGSGVMIFDCSRWDEAVVGAIPMIEVEDLMKFLGVPVISGDLPTTPLADMTHLEGRETDLPFRSERNTGDLTQNAFGTLWNAPTERIVDASQNIPSDFRKTQFGAKGGGQQEDDQDAQNVSESGTSRDVSTTERVPNAFVAGPNDKLLSELQMQLLVAYYEDCGDVKKALSRIKNEKNEGLGTGYYRHACWILDSRNLRKKRA